MNTSSRLNQAQLDILRLLSRIDTDEQARELKQIISCYYAQKATAAMDALWDAGEWNETVNDDILNQHLRTRYHGA